MIDEQGIWCAVIRRAWDDLFDLPPGTFVAQRDLAEARSFLLDREGEWARSREHVCAAAGVDPDVLRERAENKLKEQEEHV